MPEALLKDPILEPVMKRLTEKRLPTLEGARCHGPGVGVPGVLRPDTSASASDALGLVLLVCFEIRMMGRGVGHQLREDD